MVAANEAAASVSGPNTTLSIPVVGRMHASSQRVLEPLASSPAALVVPGRHGTQAFETTRWLIAQRVAVHPDRVKGPAEAEAETAAVPEAPAAHSAVTANVGTSSDDDVVIV